MKDINNKEIKIGDKVHWQFMRDGKLHEAGTQTIEIEDDKVLLNPSGCTLKGCLESRILEVIE